MRRKHLAAIIFTCLVLILAFSYLKISPVHAQELQPTPSTDEVNTIASQIYCPVCDNVPLDVCTTRACEDWRELIREKLALGWDENQIKAYFVEQYGERVLTEPPRRGFNWLAYLLPPIVFTYGLYLVIRTIMLRKRIPQAAAPIPESAPPEDHFEALFAEQVERLRK